MSYLVAIEHDNKSFSDIRTSWTEIAKANNYSVLVFKSLEEFRKDSEKSENIGRIILLLSVCLEEIKSDVANTVNELRKKYMCSILLTMFEDTTNKQIKRTELLPVNTIIYRPFDLTILKEHTLFALMGGQAVKTQFVHTTEANTAFESLKKFNIHQISEFGFKTDKKYKLQLQKSYKFYHPLFLNAKNQHIWARCTNEDREHYEFFFCQSIPPVLSQVRKKIAASQMKVKRPAWYGLSQNKQFEIVVGIQLNDSGQATSIHELLERNFNGVKVVPNRDINPKQKIHLDLLITDREYTETLLGSQFVTKPLIIRCYETPLAKRKDLEELFTIEYMRFEKNVDKALLVKLMKFFFPHVQEKEEVVQATVQLDELSSLSEVLNVKEFSEAAFSFLDEAKHKIDENMDFSLPQEDESQIKDMKARVHFVEEKPTSEGLYGHQMVLFGMRDDLLKQFRLWALQTHIEKNKGD